MIPIAALIALSREITQILPTLCKPFTSIYYDILFNFERNLFKTLNA